MKKNAIVGQSGGPTAVINASLYGVVYEALNREDVIGTIYGMINGIEGFLNENMMDMKPLEVNGELELIKTTPGSYLGSCRYKLPEDLTDAVYPQLFEKFEKYNIGYFFYIGGNDSMDTVSKLSRYAETVNSEIRFIGIPKTIDNDLVLTDHTPGFGSAAKYVASTVREIAIDASVYDNKKSVTIVEIMGRHAGWLAAASVLARKFEGDNPVLIYLPEVAFDQEQFLADVQKAFEHTSNLVVCISEGINDGNGKFVCELASDVGVDTFRKISGKPRERPPWRKSSLHRAQCQPALFFRYALCDRRERGNRFRFFRCADCTEGNNRNDDRLPPYRRCGLPHYLRSGRCKSHL